MKRTGRQETFDGRPALRFERRLAHSQERVWRAISEPAELAQIAEGYGIRGLWTQNYADGRDAFMCLMPAAAATSRILLGAVVISPYEMHPLKIANAVATLHEYSKGRGMVVIGGGGQWPGVLGVNYGKRVTGCGEAVDMAKRAVRGERVHWDGQVYKSRYFRSTWVRGEPPITRFGVGAFAYSKTFNPQRTLADLGTPSVGLEEGLDAFVRWQAAQWA